MDNEREKIDADSTLGGCAARNVRTSFQGGVGIKKCASLFETLADRIRATEDETIRQRLYWELVGLYLEDIERWASFRLTQIRGADRAPFDTLDMRDTFAHHLMPRLLEEPPELRSEGEFKAWMKQRIEWLVHDKNRPRSVHVVARVEEDKLIRIPDDAASTEGIGLEELLAQLKKELQPHDLALFKQRAANGTDFAKLAEMFGICGEDGIPSPDAARMRFNRIVRRLKESELLADYDVGE